jgi:hydrogenase maturation protease
VAGAAAARVLVAGIGNVLATDDGFGPEVVRQLPARTLLVGCQVADTGDGLGLSAPVAAAVAEAVDVVDALLADELRPSGVT